MRVLILGGTHFIGPPVVRRLIELGHEVAIFHRGQTKTPLPAEVTSFYGNRERLTDFSDNFRTYKPDVVLDTLAMTRQDAKNVVEVFAGLARRLVVLSSGDVYRAYDRLRGADPGPPDPTPLTEDSPLRDKLYPYRNYAESPDDIEYNYDKILVEQVVMAQPNVLPATILRLPMVFGPNDYQHRLFSYLKRMNDDRPYILLPKEWAICRALRGYVEDMAEAIRLCVTEEKAASRIYHVGYQTNYTEAVWIEHIANVVGWTGEIVSVPNTDLPERLRSRDAFAHDWSVDSSRIRRELGYREVVPLEEAMRRTIVWEQANPPEVDPFRFDYDAEDAVLERLKR